MKSKEEFNKEMEKYLDDGENKTLSYKIAEYTTWTMLLTFPIIGGIGFFINNGFFKLLGVISYIIWIIIIYNIISKK